MKLGYALRARHQAAREPSYYALLGPTPGELFSLVLFHHSMVMMHAVSLRYNSSHAVLS